MTGKKRTKRTSKISGAHKIKDKATGGYVNGQELVFMVLVTDIVTFPMGFRFYEPDPELCVWRKQDKALRQKGSANKQRPSRPKPDHCRYLTMQSLTLDMLQKFVDDYPWQQDNTSDHAGCLVERLNAEALIDTIKEVVRADDEELVWASCPLSLMSAWLRV